MAPRRDNAPKQFREAPCERCGEIFQKTGANHKRCEPCKREAHNEAGRLWSKVRSRRLSHCSECKVPFPPDVHGHQRYCGECLPVVRREQSRRQYATDPDRHRDKALRHYYRNKSAILEERKSPDGRQKIADQIKRRRAGDPGYRLHCNISRIIAMCLNGQKGGRSWERIVGYTLADLRAHLERQFLRGMSWENYGTVWHVDHIVPRASFDFETADDPGFKACWAITNLRPLWSLDNTKKGAKRTFLL